MRTLALLLIVMACSLNAHAADQNGSQSGGRPNVVMIYIDDMGYGDIGAFGNTAVPTPNMDCLAKEGMQFTNYYSNSPICSASRVALVTGQYQQRYRIHSFLNYRKRNRDRKMPDYLPASAFTYAKLLKQNGYATATTRPWSLLKDARNVLIPNSHSIHAMHIPEFQRCVRRTRQKSETVGLRSTSILFVKLVEHGTASEKGRLPGL